MKCDFCENGFVQFDDESALNEFLIELMNECDLDMVSVVADKDITTQLLWYAVTDKCNFGIIELDKYNYDDAYVTTIHKSFDNKEELEIDVCKAMLDDERPYLATDCTTFIQYNLPSKCEYIEDVIDNDLIDDFDPQFFVIGEYNEEKSKPEEKHDEKYTYANHVDGKNSSGDIFIESTSKEFVNAIKELFNEYFVD